MRRLYIDESGDHTYKRLDDLDKRYLGLTGVLFDKSRYDKEAQPRLEDIKRRIFRYDPDNPPILTRNQIKNRKHWFYVLQDPLLNQQWEQEILSFLESLTPYTQVFSVVIDKKTHLESHPRRTFDPYVYCLQVLLDRTRGYMNLKGGQADVVAESRGKTEDDQIVRAYKSLLVNGSRYADGKQYRERFPSERLNIKRKDQNIAGLQIADMLAYGQKALTIQSNGKPIPRPMSDFTRRVNNSIERMVNQYGRYMLD